MFFAHHLLHDGDPFIDVLFRHGHNLPPWDPGMMPAGQTALKKKEYAALVPPAMWHTDPGDP
jgi:hypothetical protein